MSGVPEVGHEAPDFALPSTSGDEVRLSDYRNASNILLAFFPLAFTGVCTSELCDFSTSLPDFSSRDTVVLGISVDAIPSLNAFRASEGIRIDLLSDFKRDVCRLYGTLMPDAFFSKRAYFIVDKSGVLQWKHIEDEIGHRRLNEELLDQLASLR